MDKEKKQETKNQRNKEKNPKIISQCAIKISKTDQKVVWTNIL